MSNKTSIRKVAEASVRLRVDLRLLAGMILTIPAPALFLALACHSPLFFVLAIGHNAIAAAIGVLHFLKPSSQGPLSPIPPAAAARIPTQRKKAA